MIYQFEPTTGEITKRVSASSDHLWHYGEFVIASDEVVSDETHFVNVESKTLERFPDKPSECHVWNWTSRSWVFSDAALTQEKERRRAEITRLRDAEERGGFPAFGKVFDSDPTSVQRISMAAQAAQLAPAGFSIEWTCQDNSIITLSRDQLIQMPLIMAQASNALHEKARTLKAQIDAATSIEEVEAVAW